MCVLAHPGMWKGAGSVPDELIEAMAEGGMAGLEVDHPDHDEDAAREVPGDGRAARAGGDGRVRLPRARYDPVRMGSETTDAARFAELRARAGR